MPSAPLRCVLVLFAVIEYATIPFPEPESADVTVIQLALLAALQLHPMPAVTVIPTVPLLLAEVNDCDVESSMKAQA